MNIPVVTQSARRYQVLGGFFLLCVISWMVRHLYQLVHNGHASPIWVFMSAMLVGSLLLAWSERPYKRRAADVFLSPLRVTVNVPLYNEDPAIVRQVLQSILNQTRKPQAVEVVDDGSSIDYGPLVSWWVVAARDTGIQGTWIRTENGGKRHAQLETFKRDIDSKIFVTVDSDSILAPDAIEQGLIPFRDPEVTSVAAIVLAMNAKANLVTRLTDLMFLNFQLVTRSGLSRLKSVLVNSGCLAFYRAEIIREAIPAYENETFWGRGVQFSDDSFLTLAAHLKGKTVQQPTSIAFTWLPEKTSHHLRQQLRWNRGSTIRSIWRFRYLEMSRVSYWIHFLNWANFGILLTVFGYLIIYQPVIHHEVAPWLFAVSIAVGYLTSLKYLTIRRSDVSFKWQLATFAMAPLLLLWTALVLRPLRLYGMATCWKTGWGTRSQGAEIAL